MSCHIVRAYEANGFAAWLKSQRKMALPSNSCGERRAEKINDIFDNHSESHTLEFVLRKHNGATALAVFVGSLAVGCERFFSLGNERTFAANSR